MMMVRGYKIETIVANQGDYNKGENMFQITKEFLNEKPMESDKRWVNDQDFKHNDLVDFNILDFCIEESNKNGRTRYHGKQKMKVLSGSNKGKEYTHTWWDVLEEGNKELPGRSARYLTWALQGMGMTDEELEAKPITSCIELAIGRSFSAVCRQKPNRQGDGYYTSWLKHRPLV